MTTKKPNKRQPAQEQPAKTEIAKSKELSDDELEEVSGGVASTGGVGASSTDSCVSTF